MGEWKKQIQVWHWRIPAGCNLYLRRRSSTQFNPCWYVNLNCVTGSADVRFHQHREKTKTKKRKHFGYYSEIMARLIFLWKGRQVETFASVPSQKAEGETRTLKFQTLKFTCSWETFLSLSIFWRTLSSLSAFTVADSQRVCLGSPFGRIARCRANEMHAFASSDWRVISHLTGRRVDGRDLWLYCAQRPSVTVKQSGGFPGQKHTQGALVLPV